MLSYILLSLIGFLGAFWALPLLMFRPLGLQVFKITETSKVNLIRKRSSICTVDYDGKASGFMFGKWYVAYAKISSWNAGGPSVHLITTKTIHDQLVKLDRSTATDGAGADAVVKRETITIYCRNGPFYYINWIKRDIDVTEFQPRENQLELNDQIILKYKKNGRVVVYIYGDTGSGKSMTPILLAKQLNGSMCKTFNPTEPNETLNSLHSAVDPTPDAPLIVVLEEVDGIIRRLHNEKCISHKNFPIMIKDKTGWNTFLDDMALGLYPNTILIMTSNVSKCKCDKMDPSYLRPGRVHICYSM